MFVIVQVVVTVIQESHMRTMWFCLEGLKAGGSVSY